MDDKMIQIPRADSIRGLVQDLSERLDARMAELRQATPFGNVSPADAKMFMLISRQPRSVADLARALGISRQAAHKTVSRLIAADAVELQDLPDNRRDKLVVVTRRGHEARRYASTMISTIEGEIESKLGRDRMELLRDLLCELLERPRAS